MFPFLGINGGLYIQLQWNPPDIATNDKRIIVLVKRYLTKVIEYTNMTRIS